MVTVPDALENIAIRLKSPKIVKMESLGVHTSGTGNDLLRDQISKFVDPWIEGPSLCT
jgi:hypothetical protein